MSHFTVMVIGDNVEEQLAPYQENNMGDCPEEYMTFHDVEEEGRKEWENEGNDEWYPDLRHTLKTKDIEKDISELKKLDAWSFTLSDTFDKHKVKIGARVAVMGWINGEPGAENVRKLYGEIFEYKRFVGFDVWNRMSEKTKESWKELYTNDKELKETIEKLEWFDITVKWIDPPKQIPYKETYPEFDKFMEEYQGYKRDEKEGKYGYWENPNAKWDWYQIGGRWSGFFKLKRGTTGETGTPGLMTPEAEPGWVDSALKKDIAFDEMFDDAYDKAGERWDKINEVIKDFPKPETWEEVRDRIKNIDEARDFYNEQPMVKEFTKWTLKNKEWDDLDPYLIDKKEFQTKAGRNVFITFALLKEGKWYEKGKMGWWACVSDEDDNWEEKFFELIKGVPEDTLLTVVDCHI